ncbi:hypothetical protein [Kitasatospora aureofaciens]
MSTIDQHTAPAEPDPGAVNDGLRRYLADHAARSAGVAAPGQ